jgi:hypothetical protein
VPCHATSRRPRRNRIEEVILSIHTSQLYAWQH